MAGFGLGHHHQPLYDKSWSMYPTYDIRFRAYPLRWVNLQANRTDRIYSGCQGLGTMKYD